jgi:prephenate dehydrogenase
MIDGKNAVVVIGVGLIGGSLCSAFKNAGYHVSGVSRPTTLSKASEMKIINSGFDYSEMKGALYGSDYIFICTPLGDISRRIEEVFQYAQPGSVVSDVGSTKSVISDIAARISAHRQSEGAVFIGGHPMTGSEKRGVENSNPFLFYDAVYVLTPPENTPKDAVKSLSSLISGLGAKVMVLSPELHDRIAASVSHLPQILAVSLANHLADQDSDLFRNLAAGGFRDMTRIASSSYRIWRDIIAMNREEIRKSLRAYRGILDGVLEHIDDDRYIEKLFTRAREERQTIPRYSKGFLKPLVDVRVSVKDRPGELAKITSTVYFHDVNIKDIEIVNIREGEGGVLRIGFSGNEDAQKAADALRGVGYDVSVVD